MYKLSEEEKGRLKLWARDKRYEYLRANKYIFFEETIEDKILYSEMNVEEEVTKIVDKALASKSEIKDLFPIGDEMNEILGKLPQKDQEILKLYFIDNKLDREIADRIFCTENSVCVRRNRAYGKIRKKSKRGGK